MNSRDIQESILILMLFIDGAHECGCGWQNLIDEDEDGFFWAELDALANHVDKLSDGQVGWDKVFLFVDCGNVGFFDLFADYLEERKWLVGGMCRD